MKSFERILVVVDSSADRQPAVEVAVELARMDDTAITLTHVLEDVPSYARWVVPEKFESLVAERWHLTLEQIKRSLEEHGVEAAVALQRGKLSLEVMREAERRRSDLVLKTRDRENAAEEMRLLRKCPCPIWLVDPGRAAVRRILAAIDPEPADRTKTTLATTVIEHAASVAARLSAELHVLHAWRVFGENVLGFAEVRDEAARLEKTSRERVTQLLEQCDVSLEPDRLALPRGNAQAAIEAYVGDTEIDLVVMGTIGRTGIPGLLIGNTAEGVFQRVSCSILAIKPPGFTAPMMIDDT